MNLLQYNEAEKTMQNILYFLRIISYWKNSKGYIVRKNIYFFLTKLNKSYYFNMAI